MAKSKPSKLYRIDMRIAATAYIKATSKKAAMKIAREHENDTLELAEDGDLICGLRFSDPDLPDFSLSPAMTVGRPYAYVECVDD